MREIGELSAMMNGKVSMVMLSVSSLAMATLHEFLGKKYTNKIEI